MFKKFNGDKVFAILILISMFIFLVGSTFAYFNSFIESDEDVINLTAMNFSVNANINVKYNEKKLVPMNDEDIYTGYNNRCVDIYGFGACHAYTIELVNDGDDVTLSGNIVFSVEDISDKLSYIVFNDSKDNFNETDVFVNKTSIVDGNTLSLGNNIELSSGETKTYTLFIWLTNIDDKQEDEDANGSYSANVSYILSNGSRITGTFVG